MTWRNYINRKIGTEYKPIWDKIDMMIFLRVPSWSFVERWRKEQAMKNEENIGELRLERFIQFFERISRQMLEPQIRIHEGGTLVVELGDDHNIEKIKIQ